MWKWIREEGTSNEIQSPGGGSIMMRMAKSEGKHKWKVKNTELSILSNSLCLESKKGRRNSMYEVFFLKNIYISK